MLKKDSMELVNCVRQSVGDCEIRQCGELALKAQS